MSVSVWKSRAGTNLYIPAFCLFVTQNSNNLPKYFPPPLNSPTTAVVAILRTNFLVIGLRITDHDEESHGAWAS